METALNRHAVPDAAASTTGAARIEGSVAPRLLRVALAGIARQLRIWIDRPRALGDAVHAAARDQDVGRLSFLHPVLEQGQRVELREARSAGAVMDAGNQEQPKEVLCCWASAHQFLNPVVVGDRR